MVMPFDWQVWTILVLVLVSAEVAKRFMPEVFKKDPIIVLKSLIFLMFFIRNAFETAPSAQKLEDFDKYGLKFRYDRESHPEGIRVQGSI